VLGLALILVCLPAGGWANGAVENQEAASQEKNALSPVWSSRFQIEIYGGAATLNPSDLNLFVDYDNHIQEFFFDSYLAYKTRSGALRSWDVRRDGERKKIKIGLPFGLRLKYRWNSSISVSLGFKYIFGRRSTDFQYDYIQTMTWGDKFTETENHNPYTLSAGGWAPLFGLHLSQGLSDNLSLEAFLAGGPIFARCRYASDWSYRLMIQEEVNPSQGTNAPYLAFEREGHLEEEGTGTGLAVEAGLRLDWSFGRRWGVFAEAGYAYQRVKSLSGEGHEVNGVESSSWENSWSLRSEEISTYWGETRLEFPTNFRPQSGDDRRVRDFSLNLSGLQVRLGIVFRI